MRAAQLSNYGGKDALQLTTEATKPAAKEGQVLVKVEAASVNAIDWKIREGMMQQMAQLTFPATLGGDLAGTVVEVGQGVTEFEAGQEVYGQTNPFSGAGSFAEFSPIAAANLAIKPKSTDFTHTAALPLTAVSAYQALVETLNLQAGQKVLIHGGAGGIGSFAIQLAKHLGAYVATTAAPEDIEFALSLGADEAIDFTTQKFEETLSDYDAVFDTVGGEAYEKSFVILKQGGKIVSMVMPVDETRMKEYGVTAFSQFTRVTTDRLSKVAELVDQDVLKPSVDKVFSLEQAAEAVEYMRQGHHQGKVVIKMTD